MEKKQGGALAFFKLEEHGTNVRTEVVAGLVTFVTMAYIIIVNQSILSMTGIPAGAVILATCIAALIGTFMMVLANVPFAQAPGMGLNAFFTFTVCFGLGFSWQQALAMVFICGIINFIITVTNIRKLIIVSIPKELQSSIGVGIGIFIAYIGIKNAGFLSFTIDPGTYIMLGDGNPATTTIIANSSVIPGLVAINSPELIMAVVSIIVMIILVVIEVVGKRLKGAILISIIGTTIIGGFVGLTSVDFSGYMATLSQSFSDLGGVFGESVRAVPSLFADSTKILMVLVTIFAFSLTDTFDTIGTLLGTGRGTKIFTDEEIREVATLKGFKTRLEKALLADSLATSIGSLFGTSNTTTYIESGAGIAAGGRTGLTSVMTCICFAASMFLAPLVLAVPGWATAPALIVVGVFMASALRDIEWSIDNIVTTFPAFLTGVFMAFSYSITTGIAIGFLVFCVTKIASGKVKEIHPVLGIVTILFMLNFLFNALGL